MSARTPGKISICRDHPDPVTNLSLISLRADDRTFSRQAIADIYCAEVGSEDAANAEFLVSAWNSHDQLVAALRNMGGYLTTSGYGDDHPWRVEINAALAAAGAV